MYNQIKRYNKFNNVQQTYDGYNYDSRAEADYAMELDLRLKAKDIKDWERQYKVDIRYPMPEGKLICTYKVDFRIHHNDDSFELIEVKGMETSTYRLKRKLLEVIWLPENLDHTYTVVKHQSRRKR